MTIKPYMLTKECLQKIILIYFPPLNNISRTLLLFFKKQRNIFTLFATAVVTVYSVTTKFTQMISLENYVRM